MHKCDYENTLDEDTTISFSIIADFCNLVIEQGSLDNALQLMISQALPEDVCKEKNKAFKVIRAINSSKEHLDNIRNNLDKFNIHLQSVLADLENAEG